MSSLAMPVRPVLADRLPGALVRDVALVIGGAALTGLAAQISIHTPISPVPFTGQTFAVLLVGAGLGTLRGTLSMLLYVAAGVLGVPWFAGGATGTGGATFGYLIGFVIAAAVAGALARRGADRRFGTSVALMVAGSAVIYLCGATYLAFSLHLSGSQAFAFGIRPFLVTDSIKLLLAAGLLPAAWKLAGER